MASGNDELVALVDFGNTLVDETFLWRDSDTFPDWTRHWSELMKAIGPSWDRGSVSTDVVLAEMAARIGRSIQEIEPCTASYTLNLAQSRTAVAIAVRGVLHDPDALCALPGHTRTITTTLATPLGNRVVVDADSSNAVPVTGRR